MPSTLPPLPTAERPEAPPQPRARAVPCVDVIDCEVHMTKPKPLHVAIALGGTDLGRSGIGTYVREMLPPLISRVLAEGGSVTAFGHAQELAAYQPALAGAAGQRLRGVPLRPALNALWHVLRAGKYARRAGADVLLLPAANRRVARSAGVPVVAVVHDLAQLRVAEKYDRLRMAYFHRVLLPAFRQPQRLIAVSSATRNDLVASLRIPEDRIRVVYNGVDTRQFQGLDHPPGRIQRARESAGLAAGPYLLYPARLEHPGKNHVRLLRAFAASGLASTHTLALSGADWGGRALIESTITELNLSGAVRFLGFVPSGDLALLMAGADAVLMLGLHEGFGLPALEGLAAGRSICVSNTGALPEVVGSLGVQCDPLDESSIAAALVRAVRDESVRRRCAAEGPAWAGRFTWDRTAEGLLTACHDVAG